MFRPGYILFFLILLTLCFSCSEEELSLVGDDQDSVEADSLLSLNWDLYAAHLKTAPDSALFYMEKVRAIAVSAEKPKWIANAEWGIADLQNGKGLLGEAIHNYLKASRYFKENGELYKLANIYMSIGNVYSKADEFKVSYDYFTKAKDIFIYEGNSYDKTRIYRNLSICATKLGDYQAAEEQLLQAEKIALQAKDYHSLSLICNSFGEIYFKLKDYVKAQKFYGLTIQYADSVEDGAWYKSLGYNNLGETYLLEEKFFEAKEVLSMAVLYGQEGHRDQTLVQNSRNLLGKLLIHEGDYIQAISTIEEGLEEFDPEVVDKSISEGLALINGSLLKINESVDPSQYPDMNKMLVAYNQKLVEYNGRAAGFDERLETISQQQAIEAAVERYAYNERLILAEERAAKMKYLFMIPVFLLICALISAYVTLRRNMHYKKLYRNIEQVLKKSKALRHHPKN